MRSKTMISVFPMDRTVAVGLVLVRVAHSHGISLASPGLARPRLGVLMAAAQGTLPPAVRSPIVGMPFTTIIPTTVMARSIGTIGNGAVERAAHRPELRLQ